MSVIPLVIGGPNRTVVQSQAEFSVEGDAVLITELQAAQLMQQGESNASYDLRIGRQVRDHHEQTVRDIPEGGVVRLRPGAALIIQTEETFHLPRRMYGTIAPKVSLLEKGLSTTFSKVDPGYSGHLLITLFNLGKTTVPLRRGSRFCALTLFRVEGEAHLYEKGAKQITAQTVRQPWNPIAWLERHPATANFLILAANVIVLIATLAVRR